MASDGLNTALIIITDGTLTLIAKLSDITAPPPPAAATFIEHRFSWALIRHYYQRTPVVDNPFQQQLSTPGRPALAGNVRGSAVATRSRMLWLRGSRCDVLRSFAAGAPDYGAGCWIARGAYTTHRRAPMRGQAGAHGRLPLSGTYAARPRKRPCRRQRVNHSRRGSVSEAVLLALL